MIYKLNMKQAKCCMLSSFGGINTEMRLSVYLLSNSCMFTMKMQIIYIERDVFCVPFTSKKLIKNISWIRKHIIGFCGCIYSSLTKL